MIGIVGIICLVVGIAVGFLWHGKVDITIRRVDHEKVKRNAPLVAGFKPQADINEDRLPGDDDE